MVEGALQRVHLIQASVLSAELCETMACELDLQKQKPTELQMALSLSGLLPPSGHVLVL